MAAAEVIPEDEITTENLVALFKRAFFSTSLGDDGGLFVKTDGPQVYVSVNEDHKLLRYMVVLGVKETAPLELKHELANKMNDSLIFGRFSIPEYFTDRLVADYSLPFEEGIPAFQIVSALRRFARAVDYAIDNYDDEELIE